MKFREITTRYVPSASVCHESDCEILYSLRRTHRSGQEPALLIGRYLRLRAGVVTPLSFKAGLLEDAVDELGVITIWLGAEAARVASS